MNQMEPEEPETPVRGQPIDRASSGSANNDGPSAPGWGARLAIAGIVLAISVIILLHLAGVIGPGLH